MGGLYVTILEPKYVPDPLEYLDKLLTNLDKIVIGFVYLAPISEKLDSKVVDEIEESIVSRARSIDVSEGKGVTVEDLVDIVSGYILGEYVGMKAATYFYLSLLLLMNYVTGNLSTYRVSGEVSTDGAKYSYIALVVTPRTELDMDEIRQDLEADLRAVTGV
ncbi:MAG: hypothetical protein DRJ40_06450 [Thermoprotei archaeon]|nr:MAG: hypothetical protein DRJ40_06450 [Thermoprotei archaeon]